MLGANVVSTDDHGDTPLHVAVGSGDLDAVVYGPVFALLLDHGASIEAQNERGETPLHYAAMHADLGVVELLLAQGASPLVKDRNGWTALHRASGNGHAAVAEVLIKNGASLFAALTVGQETPLHLAAQEGQGRSCNRTAGTRCFPAGPRQGRQKPPSMGPRTGPMPQW